MRRFLPATAVTLLITVGLVRSVSAQSSSHGAPVPTAVPLPVTQPVPLAPTPRALPSAAPVHSPHPSPRPSDPIVGRWDCGLTNVTFKANGVFQTSEGETSTWRSVGNKQYLITDAVASSGQRLAAANFYDSQTLIADFGHDPKSLSTATCYRAPVKTNYTNFAGAVQSILTVAPNFPSMHSRLVVDGPVDGAGCGVLPNSVACQVDIFHEDQARVRYSSYASALQSMANSLGGSVSSKCYNDPNPSRAFSESLLETDYVDARGTRFYLVLQLFGTPAGPAGPASVDGRLQFGTGQEPDFFQFRRSSPC